MVAQFRRKNLPNSVIKKSLITTNSHMSPTKWNTSFHMLLKIISFSPLYPRKRKLPRPSPINEYIFGKCHFCYVMQTCYLLIESPRLLIFSLKHSRPHLHERNDRGNFTNTLGTMASCFQWDFFEQKTGFLGQIFTGALRIVHFMKMAPGTAAETGNKDQPLISSFN